MIYFAYFKRPIDIAVSMVALTVAFPIIILIALSIKILDNGPIVFSQQRVGTNGANFILFKFRTMPVNTGDLPSDKLGQIQISAVGKFLRRSNLDELPQLFNVIRGDMSLIGPRPQLPSQTELFHLRERFGVFKVRPGLSGWAQVNSFDNMTIAEKVELDSHYVSNASLRFDAWILVRTISYFFKPPPVY